MDKETLNKEFGKLNRNNLYTVGINGTRHPCFKNGFDVEMSLRQLFLDDKLIFLFVYFDLVIIKHNADKEYFEQFPNALLMFM